MEKDGTTIEFCNISCNAGYGIHANNINNLINLFGKIGYSGPCPPPDKSHRYYFRVYILDTSLDLPAGADWKRFDEAISGHVIQEGYAIASYSVKLTPN